MIFASFFKFWFFEAPVSIMAFFSSLNSAFLQLVSLPLLIHTFFKPLKNEYRKGLVGFSIGMGILIKTVIIVADLFLFIYLLLFEIIFLTIFILFPVLVIYFLIKILI